MQLVSITKFLVKLIMGASSLDKNIKLNSNVNNVICQYRLT